MTYYLLPFLLLFFGCSDSSGTDTDPAEDPTTVATIILVRHAEKAAGDDPPLTPAGTARAERLRERLTRQNVTAVYSTDTRRTQATATPTAADHGLEVRSYDAGSSDLATTLREAAPGQTILVVGHSNTIPALLVALVPETSAPTISEDDFGNLYRVTLAPGRAPRLRQLRY